MFAFLTIVDYCCGIRDEDDTRLIDIFQFRYQSYDYLLHRQILEFVKFHFSFRFKISLLRTYVEFMLCNYWRYFFQLILIQIS